MQSGDGACDFAESVILVIKNKTSKEILMYYRQAALDQGALDTYYLSGGESIAP
jgi:hypothetical protein